jgi:hypothetical protein
LEVVTERDLPKVEMQALGVGDFLEKGVDFDPVALRHTEIVDFAEIDGAQWDDLLR